MPVKESGKRAKWWKNPFGDRSTAASPAPSPTRSIVKVQSPKQGGVQRGTKASSDATEQYAPSKPSAADVQTTRAGADAGGKEPRHLATASSLKNTPKSPPGASRQTLKGHSEGVTSVTFSPDGTTLASTSWDETVWLWDTATGASRQTLKGHSQSIASVAFSPDGTTLASASRDKTVRLWDTATGASRQTLKGHSGSVTSVAFSPDGTTLASASWDKTVQLWDTASGASRQTLKGHSEGVTSVTFSPDGTTLASTSWDETVWLWDTATGASRQTLKGHSQSIASVAFSPDGTTLASASWDRTVRLWDTATGASKQTFDLALAIGKISFSSDGSCLHTDQGFLDIRRGIASPPSPSATPALFFREQWIVCGSETLLWLPPEYQATSMAVFKDIIALGHGSGRVSIIEFPIVSKD